MSILLTGAAGFIGSCILRTLNNMGLEDIIIVDNIERSEKWLNIRNKRYSEYIHKSELPGRLKSLELSCIIHMGACSSTTEQDFDYLYGNNFAYSKMLWQCAADRRIPFIYASSAATYGDGSLGFDDESDIDRLLPLNRYGYSKQIFDQWAAKQDCRPPQHVGLKFFNVFGPNEYAKGGMASMVYHGFNQIKSDGEIRLFKSCNKEYADGGQLRDFVYVKDVCSIIRFFMGHPEISGLFNVGTGQAHTFLELAETTFSALQLTPNIRYIDMPDELESKYQYYTQSSMQKLRETGYTLPFTELKVAVADYVQQYLNQEYRVY